MNSDIIGQEPNSVLVTSPPFDETSHVLKHGDSFGVFDHFGEIRPVGIGEQGIYHFGTRHLSRFSLRIFHQRWMHLGAAVHEHNSLLSIDLCNPDIQSGNEFLLAKDTIHIHRNTLLYQGELFSTLRIQNYGLIEATFELRVVFAADFRDIFEVRGSPRDKRGRLEPPRVVAADRVELACHGLDQAKRSTLLRFDPVPTMLEADSAVYSLTLAPHQETSLAITVSFNVHDDHRPEDFRQRLRDSRRTMQRLCSQDAVIKTSNEHFNAWLDRSIADLHLLSTETPYGPFPYAGIPWFSTPFGRDALITALMFLWVNPLPARAVLEYLAAMQADDLDRDCDAEPGKVFHEIRHGEMAALNEIPYRQYYGSVDATPLFVILADAYHHRTADVAFLEELWPHIERAIQWMDEFGDRDSDGFIEYAQQAPRGIHNQGWKDSNDAIFHDDGCLAEPPTALCEVQAYAFAAYNGAARLARILGCDEIADESLAKANELRRRFEATFWSEELGTYILALDRDKRPCRVRASNAGQCLFSRIASQQRARRVADALLSRDMYSGWGVRTIAQGESRYNPMSYHNGSIWPHDNALIAWGLSCYDLKNELMQIVEGQFQMSKHMELYRQPELVCGFSRIDGAGPTRYPVACSPQAWASGSVFMFVSAMLGLDVNAVEQKVTFNDPRLPASVKVLTIERLKVGDGQLDLEIQRHRKDVSVNVLSRSNQIKLEIRK